VIKIAETPFGNYADLAEVEGTTFTDTSAKPDTIYYYAIKSIGSSDESTLSYPVISMKEAAKGINIILPEITSDNGIVWYKLDEPYGSTSAISSLPDQHSSADLSGSFTEVEGKNGGAFFFDGKCSYIQISRDDVLTDILHKAYNKLTVAFWIRPYSLDGKQMLYKQGGDAAGLSIRINDGKLQVAVATGSIDQGVRTQYVSDNIDLDSSIINRWTHVAVTFDNGIITVYLDGKAVYSGRATSNYIPAPNKGTTLGACLTINAFRDGDVSQWFYGMLDDIRIYSDVVVPVLDTSTPVDENPSASNDKKSYNKRSGNSKLNLLYLIIPSIIILSSAAALVCVRIRKKTDKLEK